MKDLKLYIPITCIKPVTRIKPGQFNHRQRQMITKSERHTTYVAVHNTTVIKSLLPSVKDIMEHMMAQQMILNKGGVYTSIKISVTPERFHQCCAELGCKMGGAYRSPVIDLVVQSGQLPIIQIVGNKEEAVKPRMVMERSKPRMVMERAKPIIKMERTK